jgi:hypothetical protein
VNQLFIELAQRVAQDYEDAADWKDARGELAALAERALATLPKPTLNVGDMKTFRDAGDGTLRTGKIIELWPEQDIAVIETDEGQLIGNYFVPYARVCDTTP